MHISWVSPAPTPPHTRTLSLEGEGGTVAPQRITLVRRDYNSWVGSETMEDYALRFTPQRFRKWSEWRVANTAFGAAAFLILEAVGATLMVQYGFANAAWAILATGLIIFLAGLPISVYAARYGVDMDLLTRGAGFGYIGSTITSLIYATFTFIFFALEAAVMAYALELALGIPPVWGYAICALVVIPLVTHGVSVISRFQVWTQPLWLVMMVVPFVAVWWLDPGVFRAAVHYAGASGEGAQFQWHFFGAALTVGVALITQMGEQVDYLRFMPARDPAKPWRWWAGVLMGGPGWVVLGVLKMLGGALLAYLAISHMVPTERAVDPNQMYLAAYEYVFPNYGWAVAATALFVVISQLKINVTNAYAGSLAWSNFFSRLTHSHPGRVVWVVFNTLIAFMLMEMNVFRALGEVLGLYSNIAIAWIMAVVADLVINKPMGWSPKGIEFKRAHLYDINPVGVGAMALASALGVLAHMGLMGEMAQAFSAVIAMVTALVTSPLIAWATQGKYYIARTSQQADERSAPRPEIPRNGLRPAVGIAPFQGGVESCGTGGVRSCSTLQTCVICQRSYEAPDMAFCPAYQGGICSLCCTLDARCGDLCKPHARLSVQWQAALRTVLPQQVWPYLKAGLAHYLLIMLVMAPLLAAVLGLVYRSQAQGLGDRLSGNATSLLDAALRSGFLSVYAVLLLIAATAAWWMVLAHKSREVAQEESNRQTQLLMEEIASHRQTDQALQQARLAAEQANQAKSRYISTISHELRTPLNSILGYAQLLHEDTGLSEHRAQAVRVIHRSGEHLLSLIDGTLDIARIESGKLSLDVRPTAFAQTVREVASMLELQAAAKGLRFVYDESSRLPDTVRMDEKRLRQILINLLGNAVKFTREGSVSLRVAHAFEMAQFEVHDSGPGMSGVELARVFEPFARGESTLAIGTGLGLTIAKMLTDLMGGELTVRSTPGAGSVFTVRLFLPEVHGAAPRPRPSLPTIVGYVGDRQRVLVVDNEESDRQLIARWLQPLGFEVVLATSGHDALALLDGLQPGGPGSPHAIFMDLAMPGIDGWETVRRLRAGGWGGVPLAIVSANAFDKGLQALDPQHGMADFLVKPVRRAELLDWLENRLALVWTRGLAAPALDPPSALPNPAPQLAADELAVLLSLVRLGYYKGIVQWLDAWVLDRPEHADWAQSLRTLAREFRFEAIEQRLQAHTPGPASRSEAS
jgi:signal transduction histidine kinase/purine-cytosine permease-like protein/FixJ family two-component response regulator